MKKINSLAKVLFSTFIIFSGLLVSCVKEPFPGGNPHQPPGTLAINLSYHANNPDVANFEMIVSSLKGTILLDTIGLVDTKISTYLRTNDQTFNITFVHFDSLAIPQYTVNTYTNVNPSSWVKVQPTGITYFNPLVEAPATPATLHYSNTPSSEQPFFANELGQEGSLITTGPGTIDVTYDRHAGNYAYILFPNAALYNFHMPLNDADTVDLSHMDTAVGVNFIKPSGYNLVLSLLNGHTDTTDPAKNLELYINILINSPYELEYPKKFVEKYEFLGIWGNFTGETNTYYSYNDTVPGAGSIAFQGTSNYSIGANQEDSFAIQFSNVNPSYYSTQWNSNNTIFWTIYSPSDSTTQHPLRLFSAQKSKLLSGQDLSTLTLGSLRFETVQGANYPNYFNYIFNPALYNQKLLRSSIAYQKTFSN